MAQQQQMMNQKIVVMNGAGGGMNGTGMTIMGQQTMSQGMVGGHKQQQQPGHNMGMMIDTRTGAMIGQQNLGLVGDNMGMVGQQRMIQVQGNNMGIGDQGALMQGNIGMM